VSWWAGDEHGETAADSASHFRWRGAGGALMSDGDEHAVRGRWRRKEAAISSENRLGEQSV